MPVCRIDGHAHVFHRALPMEGSRRYTPDRDATVGEYVAHLDQHGFTHGVLVQPSFLGYDNSHLLDALQRHPGRLRGVAVVPPDVDEGTLTSMKASGITGVRLNVYGGTVPDWSRAPWPSFLALVRSLGLHVELHCEARLLRDLVPRLLDAGLDVVVDHFGRPDPALGIDDPGFRDLLAIGGDPGLRLKISAAYRLGGVTSGTAVARAAMPLLMDIFGSERLIWGSDWPHTHFTDAMTFARAVEILQAIVPNQSERHAVLGSSSGKPFRIC